MPLARLSIFLFLVVDVACKELCICYARPSNYYDLGDLCEDAFCTMDKDTVQFPHRGTSIRLLHPHVNVIHCLVV